MRIVRILILSALLISFLGSCKTTSTVNKKWSGQAPIRIVATNTLPIQKQWKRTFDIGSGIYLSNNFEGARLNGAVLSGDTMIIALITSENSPINPSPWYAFKLWSEEKRDISLKLTYQQGARHRYYPKISKDGEQWMSVAEDKYKLGEIDTAARRPLAEAAYLNLQIGPDTTWVAGQELSTSKHAKAWVDGLAEKDYVEQFTVGRSRENRPIPGMKIGTADDTKLILVLSRQHPPEVTGYIAMQAFVEALASDTDLAKKFRAEYNAYIIPFINPDGVDNGHWRHSTAGIDLNRDWKNVNQPEVAAVQSFLAEKDKKGTFYFGVDFHSTWEDIYYTISPELKGNKPGLVPAMIKEMATELKLDPNIRPNASAERGPTSSSYMFHVLGAEALTYEIGDNTPRDLVKRKGEVSAMKLMELLLKE
ncbi:MAG: M14 family metallopeptidase [Bacteroidota bacterium]